MKFATNPYNTTHLTLGMLLHYHGKLKSFCRYLADIEENANKLHFECTDEYPSPVVSNGQSCASAACPLDSRLKNINCLNIFFNAGTARSDADWLPVNCACVPQLFQHHVDTTLCPAFLRKFVCQPVCCLPL